MTSAKLKSYGIAAGLAVVTASGIVGAAVVALGVTLPQCIPEGAGPARCAPVGQEVAASLATAGNDKASAAPQSLEARPSDMQPFPELPPRRVTLPRRENPVVEAAAAAVMADQIETASISVNPARVTAAAPVGPAEEEAVATRPVAGPLRAPAAGEAPTSTATTTPTLPTAPLPVPEPLAPMSVQEDQESEAAVASELSVVPPDAVTIAGDRVNVRATPSASGERLYVFTEGTAVTPSGQSGGWAKIADGEGRSGWVDAELLANVDLAALPEVDAAPEAAPAPAPEPAAESRIVAGAGVNVRSGPSNGSGKLFALTAGTKVEVTGEKRGWLSIVDPEGRSGWAYSDYFD